MTLREELQGFCKDNGLTPEEFMEAYNELTSLQEEYKLTKGKKYASYLTDYELKASIDDVNAAYKAYCAKSEEPVTFKNYVYTVRVFGAKTKEDLAKLNKDMIKEENETKNLPTLKDKLKNNYNRYYKNNPNAKK